MSLLDKNRLFFGLIHYILSEQKNVDWILKTSLIDFTGISSVLKEKPYKKDTLLDDVVEYVTSIKPYHVQFSKYFEHYETASESVNIPRNDWIEPTITMRFDAVSSTPDIVLELYSITNDISTLNRPNIQGALSLQLSDCKIYERTYDYDLRAWKWEQTNIDVIDGNYYISNSNDIKNLKFSVVNDEPVCTQKSVDMKDFSMNHLANRIYANGEHNLDEIKKDVDGNFKGLHINGSVFDVEKFGYDILDYDTEDYDSPTVIYDYYFLDKTENFKDFIINPEGYTKSFTKIGSTTMHLDDSINPSTLLGSSNRVFIKSRDGVVTETSEYELNFDTKGSYYISLYHGIKEYEKIYVCKLIDIDNTEKSFIQVIEGTSFIENSSETSLKQIINYNNSKTIILRSPSLDISSSKVVIHIKTNDGLRKEFTNFDFNGDNISIDMKYLKPYDHIIMTAFDYKYLYDKIYLWEDKFGRSNNIVNLQGSIFKKETYNPDYDDLQPSFLRARYEEDRPSEKVVSNPLNNLFVYENVDNSSKVFRNDWKNDMSYASFNKASLTEIVDIVYDKNNDMVIKSIILKDISALPSPSGKILVNGEIIEYNELDSDKKMITKLKRGFDGTILYMNLSSRIYPDGEEIKKDEPIHTHHKGDIVYPYEDYFIQSIDRDSTYISYSVKSPLIKTYIAPSNIKNIDGISVYRIKKINLLEPITNKSTQIIVDSYNVAPITDSSILNRLNNGNVIQYNGILKINEESIPFKTIQRDIKSKNKYILGNIELPNKYNFVDETVIFEPSESFIYGCLPTEEENFTINFLKNGVSYDMIQSGEEIHVMMNDELIYNIIGNSVYTSKGGLYGNIDGDKLYRTNGILSGIIDNDTLYSLSVGITLDSFPKTNETIQIRCDS